MRNIVENIHTLQVPAPVAEEHLAAINTLLSVIENIKVMKGAFIDPVRALVGVKDYIENERDFLENLLVIGKYIQEYKEVAK